MNVTMSMGFSNPVPLAAFTPTLSPNDTLSSDLIGKLKSFSWGPVAHLAPEGATRPETNG
jgi:hypothetical protein